MVVVFLVIGMPPALIDGEGRNGVNPIGAISKICMPYRTRLGDDTRH